MVLLKTLIVICGFTLCYKYLNRFKKVDKQMIREINEFKNEERGWKKNSLINKSKNLSTISMGITQEKLDMLGNPYNLNVHSYTLIKIALPIIFFIRMYSEFNNIVIALICAIPGFFLLDYMYKKRNDGDLTLLLLDLEDVYNSIMFKSSSGKTLGIALSEVYMVARRSKRLRKSLLRLSAKINMTANIEEALEDFKKQFNFTETNLFANALKQALETGLVENILEGQAMQVRRKNIAYLELRNSKIPDETIIYALLVFLGAMALILFIIGSDISNGFSQILI